MGSDVISKPLRAATVMLLRDGNDGMEVFMIVRHHNSDVHAGALVFPGGRVEAEDYDLAIDGAVFPAQNGVDATMAALRVAAVRETFEECGVLRFPTQMNLQKLGRHQLSATAMDDARASRVVTVMTKQERAGDGMRVLRIPLEADYGGELFEVPNPQSMPSQ